MYSILDVWSSRKPPKVVQMLVISAFTMRYYIEVATPKFYIFSYRSTHYSQVIFSQGIFAKIRSVPVLCNKMLEYFSWMLIELWCFLVKWAFYTRRGLVKLVFSARKKWGFHQKRKYYFILIKWFSHFNLTIVHVFNTLKGQDWSRKPEVGYVLPLSRECCARKDKLNKVPS